MFVPAATLSILVVPDSLFSQQLLVVVDNGLSLGFEVFEFRFEVPDARLQRFELLSVRRRPGRQSTVGVVRASA